MNVFDKLLRSRAATTIFLLAAIGAQTPHAAYVFYATANDNRFTAWLAAFALESAVLHFVIHGQRRVSYLFASVSIAMNLAYYRMHAVNIFALEGATAWLLAVALPVAIAFYSHSIAEQGDIENANAKEPETAENAVEAPHFGIRVVSPMIAQETVLRPLYGVEGQSIAPYLPEETGFDKVAPQVTETEPVAYAVAPEPERKETAVERNRRLAAEKEAQAAELRNLSTEDRRNLLRKMRANGHASTAKSELAQLFGVAPSTITRDFDAMGLQ